MSTIPRHFGLKYKEESYMFKELEKVRQETKKDFLRFKQKLASKPAVDESPVHSLHAPGPARPARVSCAAARTSRRYPSLKGPAMSAAALLQEVLGGAPRPSGLGEAAAPGKTRSFRPRDFYLRSSAFLRHQALKKPPVIASGFGTARPVVLLPPPEPPVKRRARGVLESSRHAAPRRVFHLGREREQSQEVAPLAGPCMAKERKASSVSAEDGYMEASSGRRKVRIRSNFVSESGAREAREAAGLGAQGEQESWPPSDAREAAWQALLPSRVIPTSIEEIIASLQSEAQLASDQTIKELIRSVLGQNYDITMEDISLMGKMYLKTSPMQAETPEIQAEYKFQMGAEESQMSVHKELSETMSSILQIEQEDIEWGPSEAESIVFKPQEISQVQPAEELSKPLEDGQPTSDSKEAKWVSLTAKSPEFLQIEGKEIKRMRKRKSLRPRKSSKPLCDKKLHKKIPQDYSMPHLHDLCTTIPAQELPVDLRLASRVYHTANRKGHDTLLGKFGTSFLDDRFTDEEQTDRILYGIPVMDDNQEYVHIPPTPQGIPPELAQGTRERAHKPHLEVLGEEMYAYPEFTKLFWNTAAPKFSVPESVMKETLYPKYESVQASRLLTDKLSYKSSVITLHQHSRTNFWCFLPRKSASFESIQKWFSAQPTQLRRVKSSVDLRKEKIIAPLEIKNDMQSSIKEVMFQKAKELKRQLQLTKQNKTEEPNYVKESIDDIFDNMCEKHSLRNLSLTLIEASKKAGISYIVYPKKKKMRWKKRLKQQKLIFVHEELSKPPKSLERSASHGILPGQKKYLFKVPLYERQIRCPSLPLYLNFEKFVQAKGGIPENIDPRTWALDRLIEYKDASIPVKEKDDKISVPEDPPERVKEPPKLKLNDYVESDLPQEVIKYYESEVKILTEEINDKTKYPAFAYCRRGAIYRKLGKLQSAMNDLQRVILLEPLFLNAYWHRHLIYLFQDKINEALDDLNYIHKYNKNNTEAYLSKAEIYRGKKDITLAILNYTQAIKSTPTDADIYFRRGEMYEITNKVLAIDDFSKCIFYDPKRTDALLKRGLFYCENENWFAAIEDFTALLNIDHQNSQARTYRGIAYVKWKFYKEATQDFSAAIHLDPNNWLALYYRGCLFRKSNPFRALQDYSVSALINDGYENLGCFLHRGIVYAHLKLWLLAICDFETVISLERTITLAYVNIGLIHLLHLDNYTEAIWQFSEAIRIDPLCIQSYLCRAETYFKLHKLKKAVNELSRAIHLQPDGIQLYIRRGQYLLMMKYYDLAKFTIYQIAEMDKGLSELSPMQQALIYSFCENHDKAIEVLDGISWNRAEMTMCALLAKVQMKAKRTKEAVEVLKKALDAISHSDKGPDATAISADCLYNLGLCYMEEGNLQMAFDSFTKAVKANPDFAESFYQRGLCKVKLHKDSSILDFNRAITLNPKHYQAYLSRVAFYGLKGRYSKAILNCNKAIKIYPESVRAYLYRGVLKYYNKTYKLAITDLTTAISMDKNSYTAFYNRALCYTKIRELQMALTDYGIVLLLDATETVKLNTFLNRGLIYVELGQYGFALEDFKQAALISRTNGSLCHATAMCHHRINEFEEAVNFFTWALKINPCFLDAYVGRGNSYMEYGHDEATKQAQKDFLKALHINPAYIKARISFGYNLQAQGKFQKAWNHFTIAIDTDPKNYLAYEGRAVVCLQMGNNFAAMQDINAAMKISTTAEFLTNRGVIHEFMGHKQNAMKDYQDAITLNPKYSLAYFNAGNIYFHHRQFSQASDYFSKALKFDPENEYVLMNRAITNTILKKYEEAKEDFANVIESCPFWAAVYFNRAHFYYCLKQYELAEEDLNKALSLKPNDALVYNFRAKVRGKIGLIEEAMADYNQALDLEDYASVI
ncbi:tetratricopeptide repeat domain 6 [Homo sapiens]|uniref:Tetratricopeptide repeat domain 6 n=2 Tax=Homo sapiens TaxID=9606 RepID=G3V3A5_HUMAN|nr:tetratricopeptide repeat protein 6 isoform 1 [Homo sapiens]KAI4060668.1 tetratricopeptide repeat domain 6 [Homo sapiens]